MCSFYHIRYNVKMYLKSIELSGFKSFAKKCELTFSSPIAGIVGPNGSGKSNTAEAFRFVLGEQSMKTMRGKRGPDLIWSGNERTPAANRARVAMVFDNKQQLLDIDFDEVILERIVHRDGANEYAINGSKVRLKDITALLSGAKIGASGHHIISQGEADRILGASEKERREIIEEALGLKTYQYKKTESERKLEKTTENIKEAKILRREIAPHLTFLERQMKKLERSRELKQELKESYRTYIVHERRFIADEVQRLASSRIEPQSELHKLKEELAQEAEPVQISTSTDELEALDTRARSLIEEKGKLEHARGRVEGQIALVGKTQTESKEHVARSIPFVKVEDFLTQMRQKIERAHEDISVVKNVIESIGSFLEQFKNTQEPEPQNTKLLHSLEEELREIQESLASLASEEVALGVSRKNALDEIAQKQAREKESQKRYFEIKEAKRDIERVLEDISREEQVLEASRENLKKIEYKAQDIGVEINELPENSIRSRIEQEQALREIGRIEARLEESGFVDEDTIREYEETKRRDAFLEREIADLEASQKTLIEIIESLDGEISVRFEEGLHKINKEFLKFFAMLFDGGTATLKLVKKVKKNEEESEEEVEEVKEGIEIRVQLPRKKVTTLDVLSGGERALTSIALIFAMSQVNPPPFIILDETDAALDEANSRKYADMVKTLAQRSQLILITHNRQTMEAAGELYGVTMGNDGISKLLSVKFDEAVSVAK